MLTLNSVFKFLEREIYSSFVKELAIVSLKPNEVKWLATTFSTKVSLLLLKEIDEFNL